MPNTTTEPATKNDLRKIIIRDPKTGAEVFECEANRFILIYDTIQDDSEIMIPLIFRYSANETQLINLLNLLVHDLGMNHALKAVIQNHYPFPYFVKQGSTA